jgi:hypothetical protein
MSQMNAWILDLGMGYKAAVGRRELLHLIDQPSVFAVPCTPLSCRHVLFWQGNLLPLMDLAARLNNIELEAPFVAVLGYQQSRGAYPKFAALKLASPPMQCAVEDGQACKLPEMDENWNGLAISCFEYHGNAVPVLNLNRLFDAQPDA